MSKAKQFAIVLSALSLAGVATTSLASGCGTDISQRTATCLSTVATTDFIKNYQANLAAEDGSNGSNYDASMYSGQPTDAQVAPSSQTTNSYTSQNTQDQSTSNDSNNKNDTQKKGINWF